MKGRVLVGTALAAFLRCADAWRQWEYLSVTDDEGCTLCESTQNEHACKKRCDEWRETWGLRHGPGLRQGHSVVLAGTRLVLFGGRGQDKMRPHVPTTFSIGEREGELLFTSYQEPLAEAAEDQRVATGQFFNDVWVYDLDCQNYNGSIRTWERGACEADGDESRGSGWELLHTGAENAMCSMQLGVEACEIPSGRWHHGAAAFEDHTVLIYGGFSQRCEDYCGDMWSLDLRSEDDHRWTEIQEIDELPDDAAAPAKRWRFSLLSDGGSMYLFGGHRLWHGFAPENSFSMKGGPWSAHGVLSGGYMNDLWRFDRETRPKVARSHDDAAPTESASYGTWTRLPPRKECSSEPTQGVASEERDHSTCSTAWPTGRAGHAAALERADGAPARLWIHGGYTTDFPYLSTTGAGFGKGVDGASKPGKRPYAAQSYFLDDLWFYDVADGTWTEVDVPDGDDKPGPRTDHVLLFTGEVLFLFGGHGDDHQYDDTWYFDLNALRWLRKRDFVLAQWEEGCEDDLAKIFAEGSDCLRLNITKSSPLSGSLSADALTTGASNPAEMQRGERSDARPPHAATHPRQYARPFVISLNETHHATVFERCMSVAGEPTRGRVLDGEFGRASEDVFIPQPRRRAPGWDGCRNISWTMPLPRSVHRAVYSKEMESVIVYGGLGRIARSSPTRAESLDAQPLSDMWQFGLKHCLNNCSDHGDCQLGFCKCHDGYYGGDCSNTSCPGTFCQWDAFHRQHTCQHCCHSGFPHDNFADSYQYFGDKFHKKSCSAAVPGMSNGICDGFGQCQCAPPFIGDDCSIKDCPGNCGGHGWCSVEFPISRCICDAGYYGMRCQYQECLNNCSYPNGNCNRNTGECECRMMYSPYNSQEEWHPWGGQDCSYILAFAGASVLQPALLLQRLLGMVIAVICAVTLFW